jgi:hypothetical protein
MKLDSKNKTIIYIVGATILGLLGFAAYNQYEKNQLPKPEPTPEPTPETTPETKKNKPATPVSAAKIEQLQKLMIRRFIQLGRENEYTESDAKGGFGNKSRSALKTLQPTNFESKGDPSSANVDYYINALTKDIEKTSQDQAANKVKQTSTDQLKKLSKDIVTYVNAGGAAKVINEFTAIKHQLDAVKNTYVPLNATRKFSKGYTFNAGDLVDRQNGQIMIKDGEYRYPTTPQNLLTYSK